MNFMQFFNEAGFAHVRRIMLGDVPEVDSVGIITAFNPASAKHTKDFNKDQNRKLMGELQAGGYGPIKIRGRFGGNTEDSYLVRNISRETLVALGQNYGQDSVIWGRKTQDENGNPFFYWEYIEKGVTTQHRVVSVSQSDVQARGDYYSEKKGRKFIIPFFQDPYKDYQPGEKFGTIQPGPPAEEPAEPATAAMSKEDFYIPYIDDEGAEDVKLTYISSELPMYRRDVRDLVEKVKHYEEQLRVPGKIGRYYWQWRSMVTEALEKLQLLV